MCTDVEIATDFQLSSLWDTVKKGRLLQVLLHVQECSFQDNRCERTIMCSFGTGVSISRQQSDKYTWEDHYKFYQCLTRHRNTIFRLYITVIGAEVSETVSKESFTF